MGAIIPYLIPIVLLELVLLFFALRDLIRRPKTKGPKWAWALAICCIQLIGPIVYLVFGRED